MQQLTLPSERLLLVHHVAQKCDCACRTVRWWAQQGLLRAIREPKTPKILRFQRQEVEAFFARRASRCH